MFLDDPVGDMEESIQPVCRRGTNSQDQEPASLLEIRDPIQTQDRNAKAVEISQKSTSWVRNKAALRSDSRRPDGTLNGHHEVVLLLRRKPNRAGQADVQWQRRRKVAGQQGVEEAETVRGHAMPQGSYHGGQRCMFCSRRKPSTMSAANHRSSAEEPRNNPKTYTRRRDAWANCPGHEGSPSCARRAGWGRRWY